MAAPGHSHPHDDPTGRLAWLFRASLRRRQVHPLLHLMQEHRQAFGVLEREPAALPPTGIAATRVPVSLDDARQHVTHLPALPQVVHELLQLLHDDAAPITDIALHVEHDQALAARVLRLANAPFYGVPGRVGSVREAVQVLGFNAVAALLTVSTLQQHFPSTHCEGFDATGFWQHTLATALLTRGLVQQLPSAARMDAEQAFAAALLHDLGLLVLTTRYAPAATAALDHARRCDLPLYEAEHDVLGCDHTQIGTLLATHWRFSPALTDAIAHHHAPPPAAWDAPPTLTDAVHAAHALVHALDLDGHPHEQVPPLDMAAWQRLRLPTDRCLALLAQAETGITQLCKELAL